MNLLAYRDRDLFAQLRRKLLPELAEQTQALGRRLRFMEVCGTHTVAFSKTGVRQVLAEHVELISGPGCPVCVTDQTDIDHMIAFAKEAGAIVATFGDMMKVPGSTSSLYRQRAEGADVRVVYSPSQAVEIARANPHRQVVFLGVGFETTAPSVALSIKKAARERVGNYFVYSAHKLTPPALQALLADPGHLLDGFFLPGHVSVIIGRRGWTLLESLNQPAVIGGFEPLDLLVSIYRLVRELKRPRRSVINNYPRIVREDGNPVAQAVLADVFEVGEAAWRGFGTMAQSGLRIAPAYAAHDAATAIPIDRPLSKTVRGCRCGEVVKGKESPLQCALFATACTPENPLGPCMVSTEGACSIYYQYERADRQDQGGGRDAHSAGPRGRGRPDPSADDGALSPGILR
ncbi:MAG TPA: hydrogenase formation protein HypD [Symbiobacteriaceae bacterium]|nr:hydrogenase formation protein HypD [Symbiobacteriaceae bacterium]